MEVVEVMNKCAGINSLMSHAESEALYELAKSCPKNGVIVEIGTWKGVSAVWMAGAAEGKNPVYTIDLFIMQLGYRGDNTDFYAEVEKVIKNSGLNITLLRGDSVEIGKSFDKPIAMLFIDGDHELEKVQKDFEVWFPKVILGGVVAIHDAGGCRSGPTEVAEKLKTLEFKDYKIAQTLASAIKV